MTRRLRVLGFEPFDAGSHRAVRESISRRSRHDCRWVCRPGRAWKWRMRLAALELVRQQEFRDAADPPPDVILATSLLSASDLRAALPASARQVPMVLYMHENQAAYPAGAATPLDRERDVHFALTNLAGVLTADRVLWNSAWNRDSFLDGMARILADAPDLVLPGWREDVENRSEVLWPPVEPPPAPAPDGRPLRRPARVVWPHRWEHDKGPDELLQVALRETERCDLRWIILGERFRRVPPALDALQQELAGRIDHVGFVEDRAAYWRQLDAADWVLSTARHEYFGVAVVEALLAGCLPWLPPRLSYPELLPSGAHGLSPDAPPSDPSRVRADVRRHLRPATASEAVARLDDALEQATAR
ncbi:MAG: tRNA-queuosine alpha-mannosyltransferase domain-containing protein [Planctomycetota bacterium]